MYLNTTFDLPVILDRQFPSVIIINETCKKATYYQTKQQSAWATEVKILVSGFQMYTNTTNGTLPTNSNSEEPKALMETDKLLTKPPWT